MASGVDELIRIDDPSCSASAVPATPPTAVLESHLQKVFLSSEAFHFCITQCLSTEVEEVMGLLIGDVDATNGHCYVTNSLPLKRLDKRKDRVEIGTEQLASSFCAVDELNNLRADRGVRDGKQLRVVGWYHSHPHITVFPSEVDIATHHQYQSQMSPFWLGLIFGVFNYEDATATNRFQLIGFQSLEKSSNNGGALANGNKAESGGRPSLKHAVVPIVVESIPKPGVDEWALRKTATLIDLLLEEEKEAYLLNRGEGGEPHETMGSHYNACVYSKAVAKIVTLLGAPMVDMLNDRREKLARLTELDPSGQ